MSIKELSISETLNLDHDELRHRAIYALALSKVPFTLDDVMEFVGHVQFQQISIALIHLALNGKVAVNFDPDKEDWVYSYADPIDTLLPADDPKEDDSTP
jgi:hypothetical protein